MLYNIIMNKRSKVEIKGFFAKNYNLVLNLISLGFYNKVINSGINLMKLKKMDRVLDLGGGPGKNSYLILKRMNFKGDVVYVDVSDEMINQAKKYEKKTNNYKIVKASIIGELPFNEEFDHVFISFVFHGFENYDKEKILKNVYKSLKSGGYLNILDWAEFDLSKANYFIKVFLNYLECELASEFIRLDLSEFVKPFGFKTIEESLIASNYIRLFIAQKI